MAIGTVAVSAAIALALVVWCAVVRDSQARLRALLWVLVAIPVLDGALYVLRRFFFPELY